MLFLNQLEMWQLLLAGGVGMVLLALTVVRFRFALIVVALCLGAASIGINRDFFMRPVPSIIMPLQMQRTPLFAVTGFLLALATLFHISKIIPRGLSGLSIMVLLLGAYGGLVRMVATDPEEGLYSIGFALLTVLPLALVAPSYIRSTTDSFTMIRAMGFVGALYNIGVAAQLAVSRRPLTSGSVSNRFVGLSGNPQLAAVLLATMTVISVFLLLNDPKQRYKLFWTCNAAVSGVLLLWTASRTGLTMALIGTVAVTYGRAGRALLLLPFAGGAAYFAYTYLISNRVDIQIGDRITQGGNTRAESWAELIRTTLDNPAFGLGGTGTGTQGYVEKSENSLLYGMASYGVGMGLLIVIFALMTAAVFMKLLRSRRYMSVPDRRIAEFCMGFFLMYWGGAVFEGYVIGRVTSMNVFMVIFASIATRVMQLPHEQARAFEAEQHRLWEENGGVETVQEEPVYDPEAAAAYEHGDDGHSTGHDGYSSGHGAHPASA